MKQIILLLAFTLTCENITPHRFYSYDVYRCENEEVICYSAGHRGGLSCKFKESK